MTLEGLAGVPLRSGTVQTVAMAMHELTTNALKYGALKQEGAHLNVRWRVIERAYVNPGFTELGRRRGRRCRRPAWHR